MLGANLRKLAALPWRSWCLLAEAVVWLGLARLAIVVVPFKRIAPHVGMPDSESSPAVSERHAAIGREVGWALAVASRRTPWESACLAQAIAASRMLRRRGIGSTLYLGMTREAERGGALAAHAWLRCGPLVVVGGHALARYAIVGRFGLTLDCAGAPSHKSSATGSSGQ